MSVIAVGCDALVAFIGGGFQSDDNSFLADVQMAEPANQTHPIQLSRLFFKTADQQHLTIVFKQFFF
jgi:hypothetical protein